ncbi:MAG: DUF4010 domain-containing protein [Dokdonella sp.]
MFGLLAAIGGGLLVGVERERNKGEGVQRSAIGIRTCMLAALLGAVAALLGPHAIAILGLGLIVLTLSAYCRAQSSDPGLTTEFTVLATFALAALSMTRSQLGAALFVGLAIILVSKQTLHRFARHTLSENELQDALILAASALIVMPLLPDHAIDPLNLLNPRKLWLFAILMMSINAAGHIALRVLGPGRGLALSGLLGGFVSSAATIAGLAQRAREHPRLLAECVAGALLSNIATVLQLAVILLAVSVDLLWHLAMPLVVGGLLALGTGAMALWRARRVSSEGDTAGNGRAFSLIQALVFMLIVSLALLIGEALRRWLGFGGMLAAAAATGLADVHAATVALGQLVSSTGVPVDEAGLGVALAFAANSLTKCALSVAGGRGYALPVAGGIVVINIGFLAAVFLF